jgi:hypothetical protein
MSTFNWHFSIFPKKEAPTAVQMFMHYLNYSAIMLPKLDPNKKYFLTLVLLCQDRPQYGRTVHVWINFMNGSTQVNNFIESHSLLVDNLNQ